METKMKEQIQSLVIAWIDPENNARSGNKLASRIGISTANLSKIKNGKWEKIGTEIWNKCAAFFDINIGPQDWKQWSTYNFQVIQDALKNAQLLQRRVVIDGNTGWGKTNAIKYYCAQKGHENAIHIICRRSMNPRKFVQNIAEKLGITQIASNRYEVEDAIAVQLIKMQVPIMIIDEIENLSHSCFSSIKAIIDLTDKHCAFALSGIDVRQLITKWAIKGKDAFRQLNRRFPTMSYAYLEPLRREEMKMILQEVGIADKYAQEWFYDHIEDMDAFENTVKEGLRLSRKNSEEITRIFMADYFGEKERKIA